VLICDLICFSGSGVSGGSCPAVGSSSRCRATNASSAAAVGHGAAAAAAAIQVQYQQHLMSAVNTGVKNHQEDAGGGGASAISAYVVERNGYKPAHLTMELLYRYAKFLKAILK